jgi:hypothetical protein
MVDNRCECGWDYYIVISTWLYEEFGLFGDLREEEEALISNC